MKIEKLPVNSEVLVHLKNIESPDGRSTSIINFTEKKVLSLIQVSVKKFRVIVIGNNKQVVFREG
jgi:hypothetical protein